jgi:glycosyltransferase involved in cell wall biosynthesis
MRILWQSVAPWCPTGYGVQTANIAPILKDLGHEVFIAAYYGLQHGGFIRWRGIPLYPASAGKSWGAEYTKYYYDKFQCDACISLQDVWTLPNKYGFDFNWYPYMPIDHEPIPPFVQDRLPFAAKPIAMSQFGAAQLKSKGIDCYYAPHGVDIKVFKPTNDRLEFGDADFVVGCVAVNRGRRKNLPGLIMAFKEFHESHPKSVLYLHSRATGYNFGDPQLHILAKNVGLEDFVFFPNSRDLDEGFSDEWMAIMYSSLDVFCMPSMGEGFGVPIVEAQACGCPVIVTNFTSMPELVGGGWLLKDIQREFDYHNSWRAVTNQDEIVRCLEEAYDEKMSGAIEVRKQQAIAKAAQYDWSVIKGYWKDILDDIEKRPKRLSREGIQEPRLLLIPKEIEKKRVLDIGCGETQPYKPYLQELGEYVGVDIKGGDGVVQADACNLPFEDKSFGFVWCSEVIEHIKDAQKAVDEAKRVGEHGCIMFPTPENHNFAVDPEHLEVKLREEFPIDKYGNGVIIW